MNSITSDSVSLKDIILKEVDMEFLANVENDSCECDCNHDCGDCPLDCWIL